MLEYRYMYNIITDFSWEFIEILAEMAPYLLLGFFIAGILHAVFPTATIQKYFGTSKYSSAINASIFGIPLPLCSCGVIPTGMSLYKNGASKGATVSFLISTPQTGVDSILVTYSLLGLPFAIIRPIVAFITGVLGGVFTNYLDKDKNPKLVSANEAVNTKTLTIKEKFVDIFRYGFVEFLQDISKWLVIGLVLAAVISAAIPDDFVSGLGLSPLLQMLIVLVISIPLYICATASVPLAAVLLLKGISPGAALVLLMAGPATNAATIAMIGNVLGKKSLFTYLISIIGGALIFGLIIDYLLPASWFELINMSHLVHKHDTLPNWLKLGSGILLIILIINGYLQKYIKTLKIRNTVIEHDNMGTKRVKVEGMTCNHCKANVENNLVKLDFLRKVTADLSTGIVELEGDDINLDKVKDTVIGLGYKYSE